MVRIKLRPKARLCECSLRALALVISMVSLHCAGAELGEWARVNGHQLFFARYGAGRPLVLLHGGGSTPDASFSEQLKLLAARYQVIAPEQVGHGHTPDIDGAYSYTQMMEDTAELLAQLKVTHADFVGWSDGGILALMLAVHHPNLVRRLVVSGVNITPDGVTEEAQAEMLALHDNLRPGPSGIAGYSLLPYTTLHGPTFQQKLTDLWRDSPTADQLNLALLGRVKKRVLLMVGQHDLVKLEHTMNIYRALSAARLLIVPDTGHETFSDSPAVVNPLMLSFLDAK